MPVPLLKRGVAVPNFGDDPAGLIEIGVQSERAGFDGFFIWDHIVFADDGDGPPIIDPWQVLAVVAARTSRIRIGTMITPVPRRRPWQLARVTTTLDRLSHGRVILGVGIGSPAYGDFGIFHEPSGDRERAELLDEGLDVLAGLWTGERFSYTGEHLAVDPVCFTPTPVQRPRIPVWVAGVLPASRPIARAARWDGMVPIRLADGRLVRPSAQDISETGARIAASRGGAGGSTWPCGLRSRTFPVRWPTCCPTTSELALPGGSSPPGPDPDGGRASTIGSPPESERGRSVRTGDYPTRVRLGPGRAVRQDGPMRTLIAGGIVVTATDTARADVLVVDEQVAAVGLGLGADADLVIDANGRYVIPGAVDVHTHMELEISGTVACDDFAIGTAAAAWGGTTTIIDYAGHDKGESLLAGLARWQAKAADRAHVDYGFHMMISEVNDRVLAELAELIAAGVTSVKLFMAYPGVYMVDDAAIFRVLRRAGQLGAMVAVHAENGGPVEVLRTEFVADGRTDAAYHARSRPAILEGEATGRAIVLAELADAPVYIAHLSAAQALDAVHRARDRNRPVYAETCPQYLYLDESALSGPEPARYVCSPPLRPAGTREALWQGLRRGDLDVVATDHCPFTTEQKALGQDNFTRIPNGLHGVEERLALLHEGVHRGEISLNRWVDLAATAPAKLFGLYPRKGAIVPGADADLVVFDPASAAALSAATHHSAVDYSVYEGLTVHGRPEMVMQRGAVLVDADGFHGRPGAGQFLRRGLPRL